MTTNFIKMEYVTVAETEQDQESIELPVEDNGTILLSTVAGQFPGACGLKYRSESGSWRGLRFAEERLQFPGGQWTDITYIVVYPKDNKRKGEESAGNPVGKTRKLDMTKSQDLVVLGLPWKTTEVELKTYFEQFGEVVFSELRNKYTSLETRLSKLECISKKKSLPISTPSSSTPRLNKLRLETSLEAFSHCTQQLHQQVDVLKSHKRQHGQLPSSEITSLELSLSLLEKCLHHLRSKEEQYPTPASHVTPHQIISDVRQAFNEGAGIGYPSSSNQCRGNEPAHHQSSSHGGNEGPIPQLVTRNLNNGTGASQGAVPVTLEGREVMFHLSPISYDCEDDQSWLEFDSSLDANATMAAKIKSLVANPKWGHINFRNGAAELTRSLAHILYTREELILSTVTGRNGFEALDNVKLMAIKEAVDKKYGHSTNDFELLWKQCIISLGQHCKYLRQKCGFSHSPQPMVCPTQYRQESPEQKPVISEEREMHSIVVADIQ